jgi:hypothetical protein
MVIESIKPDFVFHTDTVEHIPTGLRKSIFPPVSAKELEILRGCEMDFVKECSLTIEGFIIRDEKRFNVSFTISGEDEGYIRKICEKVIKTFD